MEVNENLKQDDLPEIVDEPTPDSNKQSLKDPTSEPLVETYIVIPPDGGWGWIVVLAAFFSFLLSDGMIYAFGIFLDDMSKELNCTKSKAALVGATMTGIFCFTGPVISALINTFGYRKVAIFGCLLASLACLLTSLSRSLHLVFITYGIMGGIGFGMIYLPAVVAVGFYFERWRSIAVGISVCGSGIGMVVLPLFLTTFIDKNGWRYTFRILAGLSFLYNIFAFLYKPLIPISLFENTPQKQEIVTEQKKISFLNHINNSSFSRVSGIYSKSSYKLGENICTTHSKTSEKPTNLSVTTLFQYQKFAMNISSEFIMTSYPTTSSKSSFKSNRTQASKVSVENADSGLSTVYEELIHDNCCTILGNRIKSICNCRYRLCSCMNCLFDNQNSYIATRPLYKDDIFYSTSIVYLPEYQLADKRMGSKSKSVVATRTFVTKVNMQQQLKDGKQKCQLCSSEAMKNTLTRMLDFNLLKSYAFMLLLLNAVFTSMGFYAPYMFIKDRAIQNGIVEKQALLLISCIGITNTIGRITFSVITSFSKIQAVTLTYTCLLISGIATVFSGISYKVWVQFSYASIYGMSVACLSTLRTIIIVDMLGLDKLTNAFGITLLFQGIAAMAGTSFSSFLIELTGNYEMSFYFAGGSIITGALFLIPLRKVSVWEKIKQQNVNNVINKI